MRTDFRRIIKKFIPNDLARFKQLIGEADELDGKGLFEDALLPLQKALAIRPKNCRVHLKLGELYFKQKEYEQAKRFLFDAKLYARTSHERFFVTHLEYQIFSKMKADHFTQEFIEKGLNLMDKALAEKPQNCLSMGTKALLCLEAIRSIPSLETPEVSRYMTIAEFSMSKCLTFAKQGNRMEKKYLSRVLDEASEYAHQSYISTDLAETLKQGHRMLEKGQRFKGHGFLKMLYGCIFSLGIAFLSDGITVVVDLCDI